jgi:DNA modification methylase
MELVSWQSYREFRGRNDSVVVGDSEVRMPQKHIVDKFEPENYSPEEWTVWSFPERGKWATHSGDYPGNWSPFVPRNLLDRYTRIGENVCDPMMGGGTTLVECKLMGRNGIGVDVNPNACLITMNRLDFEYDSPYSSGHPSIRTFCGDARNLNAIGDNDIDFVALHPPYAGLIRYSKPGIADDLSLLGIEDFVVQMRTVAGECFRILKEDKVCALLIGDTRIQGHYVPLHIGVLSAFLAVGFLLKEDIIKIQHQTRSSQERWTQHNYTFYKIAHEHLYVLRKPASGEDTGIHKFSSKWW